MRYFVALLLIGSLCLAAILFFRRSASLAAEQQRTANLAIELAELRTENVRLKAAFTTRSSSNHGHDNPDNAPRNFSLTRTRALEVSPGPCRE